MKPFLCIEKPNKHRNCKDYAIRCTSEETQQEWEAVFYKNEERLSKTKRSRFAYYFSLCLLILGITTLFQALTFVSNTDSGPEIFLFLLNLFVSAASFGIYFFISHHYKKQHKLFSELAEKSNLSIRRDLEIPDDVGFTEVIFFEYEMRDGQVVPVPEKPKSPIFFNPLYFIYVEKENLIIGTDKYLFAVPLSTLKCIRKVNHKISFKFWKKAEHFSSPAYKDFDIIATKDSFEMDYFYTLEFFFDGEMWEIPFPCYELPVFQKLTGLSVITE